MKVIKRMVVDRNGLPTIVAYEDNVEPMVGGSDYQHKGKRPEKAQHTVQLAVRYTVFADADISIGDIEAAIENTILGERVTDRVDENLPKGAQLQSIEQLELE